MVVPLKSLSSKAPICWLGFEGDVNVDPLVLVLASKDEVTGRVLAFLHLPYVHYRMTLSE